MIRSLRGRLLIGTTAITTLSLFVLGAAIDTTVRRTLLAEFDAALIAKATSVASMVEQHDGKLEFEFQTSLMPEFAAAKNPEYFEVWAKGQPFVRSQSLGTSDLSSSGATASPQISWTVLPDGRRGRMVMVTFSPYIDPDEPPGVNDPTMRATIGAARSTADLDRLLSRLRWASIASCGMAIALSGAALLLLIRRATMPVKDLARRLETLNESELSTRFVIDGLPSELTPMVDRLNGLLGRLDAAFARERSFTADVAHELRTPVAGLLATLEVCRTRPRTAPEYELSIDKAISQLAPFQALVEDLLLLARVDSGQVKIDTMRVDLVPLLEECWLPFAERAHELRLSVNRRLPEKCQTHCDPHVVRIVLRNLLDNAVSYANANGEISMTLEECEGHVELEITNTGAKLNQEDIPKVFERFWRGDSSRSHIGRHAGLGLGLSQRLLSLMGNTLTVECTPDGVFTARVILSSSHEAGEVAPMAMMLS